MSLLATYRKYLSQPTTSALADNAAICYVPTLTTVKEPSGIIRHLAAQAKQFTKKREEVLHAIESVDGLCVEVEMTVEWVAGGGAILPGVDDNVIVDKVVMFPMIHIVEFEKGAGTISKIRYFWDQGSLLKDVGVIGSRGRNYPLRGGRDQLHIISNSATPPASTTTSRRSTLSRDPSEVVITGRRSHAGSIDNAMGDPKATLSLFQSSQERDDTPRNSQIAPRASSRKPPTRNLTEILAGTEAEAAAAMSPQTPIMAPPSPRKGINGGAPKAGAGKNYHPIRLFDDSEPAGIVKSPEIKTNPKKYNHFDLYPKADGPANDVPKRANKAPGHWDFEDFVTPDKPRMPKIRTQDARNFSWSDDESEAQNSPVRRQVVHQARPDAQPKFDFVDDSTPSSANSRPIPAKGRSHNDGLGLYKDNIVEDEKSALSEKQPLSTVTNVNHDHRRKDFGSQFEMTDHSPSSSSNLASVPNENTTQRRLHVNQAKVLKGLDSSWDMYDQSSNSDAKKENVPATRATHVGKTRRDDVRHWGFGEDIEEEPPRNSASSAKTQESKPAEIKSFWDF